MILFTVTSKLFWIKEQGQISPAQLVIRNIVKINMFIIQSEVSRFVLGVKFMYLISLMDRKERGKKTSRNYYYDKVEIIIFFLMGVGLSQVGLGWVG